MSLRDYLERFRRGIETLENYGYTESIEIKEEIRPNKQAAVNAKIVLINGLVLYIAEYIDARYGIDKISYGYQYQDREKRLIFRYDNAAHKPKLKPETHKHKADGTIEDAILPDIFDIIDEVVKHL